MGLSALADTSPGADPEASAEAADVRRAVSDAIGELPFNYRAAVVLRHVMGLDYAEAARALDLPLNTFKSHLLRGTKLLREGLAAELDIAGATTSDSNLRRPGEIGEMDEIVETGDARRVPERIAGG
jgi:DNA-directed RNA polymerase specialized sigma24 family protein